MNSVYLSDLKSLLYICDKSLHIIVSRIVIFIAYLESYPQLFSWLYPIKTEVRQVSRMF